MPRLSKNIIRKERPDCILATLGGQTRAESCHGARRNAAFWKSRALRLLGTNVDSIRKAEDREAFKETMETIGEPCHRKRNCNAGGGQALAFAREGGLSRLSCGPPTRWAARAAASRTTLSQLAEICADRPAGLSRVHQCLIEKSVAGWKEIEYEVMRDGKGHLHHRCATWKTSIPVGVHTGDSIVVAPSQTLARCRVPDAAARLPSASSAHWASRAAAMCSML